VDGFFPSIFHGERSELSEKYGLVARDQNPYKTIHRMLVKPPL